jgi:hypothetical protein
MRVVSQGWSITRMSRRNGPDTTVVRPGLKAWSMNTGLEGEVTGYWITGEIVGLSVIEQLLLDGIENRLAATDPELIGSFAAFSCVTRQAGLPVTEQLSGRDARAAPQHGRRTPRPVLAFVLRLVLILLAGALVVAGAVIACSAASHGSCAAQAIVTNVKVDLGMHADSHALQRCVGNVPGWNHGTRPPTHVHPGGKG